VLPRDIRTIILIVCALMPVAAREMCAHVAEVFSRQAGGRVCDAWCVATTVVGAVLALPAGYMFGRLFRWVISFGTSRHGILAAIPVTLWWLSRPWPETVRLVEHLGLSPIVGLLFLTQNPVGGVYLFWFPFFGGLLWGSGRATRGPDLVDSRYQWPASLGVGLLPVIAALATATVAGYADAVTSRVMAAIVALGAGFLLGGLPAFRWRPRHTVLHLAPILLLVAWVVFSPTHQSLIPGPMMNGRNCGPSIFGGPVLTGCMVSLSLLTGRWRGAD